MANVKISDLTAYTDPVSTDVLPIVDVGNDLTKKVSIADLLENAGTGSAAAPSFSFDGSNAGIYQPGANQLAISTSGTERLRITSAGLVAIGTSSPDSLFHISTSDATGPYITFEKTGSVISRGGITFKSNNAGTDYWGGKIVCGDNGSQGTLEFYSSYRSSSEPATAAMTLLSNGRLGIGTTSPGEPLEVSETVVGEAVVAQLVNRNQDGTGDSVSLQFRMGRTADASIMRAAKISAIKESQWTGTASTVDAALAFYTSLNESQTEKARIDSSGRLLVGTSSDISGSTATLFQIASTVATNTAYGRDYNVVNGNTISAHRYYSKTGGTWEEVGSIAFVADGTHALGDKPTRLVFSVTADGASSPTEAMRIKNSRIINFANAPTYADNTAALAGGLVAGDVYRKSDGTLMITY